MFQICRSGFLGLASALVLFSSHAGATAITSTTFNGWKSTLTGSATEADFTQVQFKGYSTSSGITLNAVGNSSVNFVFTGPDNGSYQLTGTSYNNLTGLQGPSDGGTSGINVAMPSSGENAFLFALGDTLSNATLTLTLSDSETFAVSVPSSSASYLFGLSLSHPVTSVFVSSSTGAPVIDDFYYGMSNLTQDPVSPGGTTPTAEGATAVMIAGGMLVLFGAKRKFERLANAA